MAGMPPIRCFNCNYPHGKFRDALNLLHAHIKMHPIDRPLWTQAFKEFRMCEMCRTQYISYYQEFDSHRSFTNGRIGVEYADIIHHRDIRPNNGLIDIINTYIPKNQPTDPQIDKNKNPSTKS